MSELLTSWEEARWCIDEVRFAPEGEVSHSDFYAVLAAVGCASPLEPNFKLFEIISYVALYAQLTGDRLEERRAQAKLLSDVFGGDCPFNSDWRTSTAVALATQMYDSRDFSPMPILADALQDAGCENGDILEHCRGPGPHVRGCWVVDLVLCKS